MDDSVAPVDVGSEAGRDDRVDWTWPPFGPLEEAGGARFATPEWAPASSVRRPRVRIGRWTVLYRRGEDPVCP